MSTRLPGAKYDEVFARGRSQKGRLLVAWRFVSEDTAPLGGVIVSKKTFHDAVDRNRAKRLMREAFRLLVKINAIPERTNWIFIARRAIGGVKCADVMDEIKRLCARF